MREDIQSLVKLIRASIDEAQLRSGIGELSPQRMRNVIAFMWAAHDELELIAVEANRKPPNTAPAALQPKLTASQPKPAASPPESNEISLCA